MVKDLLKIKNLTLSYEKNNREFPVFKDFSLNFPKGKKIVLLGESGSGKSTLAKVITGLLPPSAQVKSGTLQIEDFSIDLRKGFLHWHRLRGKKISMIFQDAQEALNPVMTVYEHFKDLLLFHGVMEEKEIRPAAQKLLEKLMIQDPQRVLDSYSFELSGGMCQRVCIALCISLEPEMILADEPTSALDVISENEVLHSLKYLTEQSVLMITHDISAACRLADEIFVLNKGVLCEKANPQDLLDDPVDPYTKKLIDSYKSLGKISFEQDINSEKTILEINHLSKSYVKGKKTLKEIDFHLRQGEIFGLLGESGCGKSTLSRCILGLEKVDEGEILFENENLLTMSRKKRRSLSPKIQMIFQDARGSLNPRYSILEIVQEPLFYNKIGKKETRKQKALELLRLVGLQEETFSSRPPQLSTGQCQRVGIARALMTNPEILICDEPISSLDVTTQLQILQLLMDLKMEFGLTLILISHNFRLLRNLCHRIAVMEEGRLLQIDSGEHLIQSKQSYVEKILQASLLPLDA